MIVKMARDGASASASAVLRDQHAVPDVKLATGKTIGDIIAENDLKPAIPDDLCPDEEGHRPAEPSQREQQGRRQQEEHADGGVKIRRLVRYYKRVGYLPADWQYSIKTAELLLE